MHLNMNLKNILNYINYSWDLETIYKIRLILGLKFLMLFIYISSNFLCKIIFVFKTKMRAAELRSQLTLIFKSWWKTHLEKKYFSNPGLQRVKRKVFELFQIYYDCPTILSKPLKSPL